MARAGLLTRVRGGCVLQSPFVTELSFPAQLQHQRAEKAAIARKAVQLLRPGESVCIDTRFVRDGCRRTLGRVRPWGYWARAGSAGGLRPWRILDRA